MARPLTSVERALQSPSAATTGLLLGIPIGILAADGRWWPLIAIVPFGLSLVPLVRALVPREERARVGAAIALSFALHVAVAVLLYTGSVALGRGGFIPGDDIAYADVSDNFVRYLKGEEVRPGAGPPYWAGNAYLFGTWVYLESAIFYVVGPEVLVPVLLNGVFALTAALLVYDIARRLFERRSAFLTLVLTAFYPSLVMWSSLNLKDALALLLAAICLWGLVRFQQRPRWAALAVALAILIPMHGLRPYLFFGLAILAPLVVALTPALALAARIRWTGSAIVASGLLLAVMQTGIDASPQVLVSLEEQRRAMAAGARTRFVEAPLVVKEGDTFVVPTMAPSAMAPSATTPARIVHVQSNSRIVVEIETPGPPSASGDVAVRPGDVVVVGPPEVTPRPTEQRTILTPSQVEQGVTLTRTNPPLTEVVLRSIVYLPVGLSFSLFSPFPWLLERQADRLLLPEMVLWYVCLVAATVTIRRERVRWQVLAPLALVVGGLLLLLALVEGNWATLLRHRSMTAPWVLALAAPSLLNVLGGRTPFARRSQAVTTTRCSPIDAP